MSSCAHAGPFGAQMSEGAIGTRSEELLEAVVNRIVLADRFVDTNKNDRQRYINRVE